MTTGPHEKAFYGKGLLRQKKGKGKVSSYQLSHPGLQGGLQEEPAVSDNHGSVHAVPSL